MPSSFFKRKDIKDCHTQGWVMDLSTHSRFSCDVG